MSLSREIAPMINNSQPAPIDADRWLESWTEYAGIEPAPLPKNKLRRSAAYDVLVEHEADSGAPDGFEGVELVQPLTDLAVPDEGLQLSTMVSGAKSVGPDNTVVISTEHNDQNSRSGTLFARARTRFASASQRLREELRIPEVRNTALVAVAAVAVAGASLIALRADVDEKLGDKWWDALTEADAPASLDGQPLALSSGDSDASASHIELEEIVEPTDHELLEDMLSEERGISEQEVTSALWDAASAERARAELEGRLPRLWPYGISVRGALGSETQFAVRIDGRVSTDPYDVESVLLELEDDQSEFALAS